MSNIYQRINEVKKEVTYVQKDAKVQGYKAVTHDQVTAVLRESMVKHGIVSTQSLVESSFEDTGDTTGKGTKWMMYTAKYNVSLISIEDPESQVNVIVESQALDTGDKASGKAMSYAMKYALLKTFGLETGENEEGRQDDFRQKREDKQLISSDDVENLEKLLKETDSDVDKFLNVFKIDKLEDMKKGTLKSALAALKKMAEK